jgi:hypothetical protein
MSILIFLAAIGVLAVTYVTILRDPAPIGAGSFYRYRFLAVLVVLLFGSILDVTFFLPNKRSMPAQERLELAEKYKNEIEIAAALRNLASIHKNDINAQVEFIDYDFKTLYNSIYLCEDVSKIYVIRDDVMARLSQWYIDKKCNSREPNDGILY